MSWVFQPLVPAAAQQLASNDLAVEVDTAGTLTISGQSVTIAGNKAWASGAWATGAWAETRGTGCPPGQPRSRSTLTPLAH